MTSTATAEFGVPPSAGNPLFLHNMQPLWRVDPRLALRIDAVDDEDRLPLEPTRSGHWTAAAPTPSGERIYLHSRYDPVAEADRFASAVEVENTFCFAVSGAGLGYHLRALWSRIGPEAVLICIEPSLAILATALTCVDLAGCIASGRLIFLVEDDKSRLHERLERYSTLVMLGAKFVPHAPSLRLAPDAHAAISSRLTEFVTYTRMTLSTLMANARITCRNIAMNLATYVSTPPIDILRDRFAGCPAVVVSAGPSLRRNMDQLGDLKNKAVLVAVQTAARPLLERGIVPDFVTSLDFHEMSRKFFEGLPGLKDVHLVAEPKATWHVVDAHPGPVSLLDNHWARLVLGDALAARDGLKAGATVAHLAFYLAAYLGCDPIIFVGQDLAYSGHVFYVPGVEIHRAWRSELNRFQSIEMKEWERIARNRPILRTVRGNAGGDLYTDELLFTYLEQFEKDIAALSQQVINATEGGACIRGTTVMPLAEAAARFCTRPIDSARFDYRHEADRFDASRLADAALELQARIGELEQVDGVCTELLALFGELEQLTGEPDRFNRRLGRVDELRARISHESRSYRLINSATQLAEFRRFQADRRIQAADSTAAERALMQLRRDRSFIEAVRDGAADVRSILSDALDRIRRRMEKS